MGVSLEWGLVKFETSNQVAEFHSNKSYFLLEKKEFAAN